MKFIYSEISDKFIPENQRVLGQIEGLSISCSGSSEKEVWNECMTSLKVLIAYNSGYDAEKLKELESNDFIKFDKKFLQEQINDINLKLKAAEDFETKNRLIGGLKMLEFLINYNNG